MTLFLFLTVVQAIIAFSLVCVVLMQRSEGGGLGIGGGGSPGGLMSARGAADLMTRATKWLAITFVALSIALAALAVSVTGGGEVDDSLDRSVAEVDPLAGVDGAGDGDVGEAGSAEAGGENVAPSPDASDDPLADVAD